MGMKAKWLAQDFEARLNAGIVSFQGLPYKAEASQGVIHLRDIVTGRIVHNQVDPIHNDLDCGSIALGFINTPDGAVYMQRIPSRRYKQSLDDRAIREQRLQQHGFVQEMPEGRSNYLWTKHFVDSFKKPYPSLDEAVRMLNDVCSVAISREVAITKNNLDVINVWFKLDDNPIGWVDYPKSRIVRVPSSDKAWIISNYLGEFGWEVD